MTNIIDKAASYILSKVSNTFVYAEYYKRTVDKRVNYKRQPAVMSRKEIIDWKNALIAATDPDNPKRGDLMRFYENMKLDGHLMSCVENRTLPVQCAPFKLIDKEDNEDFEAKKLLEKPWFIEMARVVCSHTFEGTKLLCMFDIDEQGELRQVEEIPQSNFIAQKGVILINEYDNDGISYREGAYKNYYFQVGGDWNLGLFSQLAMVVIAKKLGLGSWMSYIDKYGVPPIFAITERMDSTRRDELFEMLENFRMNHFAVLQGNEKIETPQGYNVDAHNTFKSLMSDICDREIEKRIQGSSGLTNEKAYVGAAEIQERILGYRHKVDKLIFKYYFNNEVKPRLIKLSPVYKPLENLTFDYDESESLSMKELLEAVRDLSEYFEFDVEELVKITGLPITKLKQTLSGTIPGNDTGKEKQGAGKKKTEEKALTPLSTRADINIKNTAFAYAGGWKEASEDLINKIRRGEINTEDLNPGFVLNTYQRLNKAAEYGYGENYYNDETARRMRENLLSFAATKTHIQQAEIKALSDSIKKDNQYNEEARKYLEIQNGAYLDVQAAWAARCSQSARQWGEFQRDKDIYPRLKIRTMNDKDVRETHHVLEGYVISLDNPDIDKYIAPFDPGCRCWNEQTTEAPTDTTPDFERNPQWAVNPGRDGIVFNENNSYNEKVKDEETRLEIRKEAEIIKEHLPYNKVIEAGDNRVFMSDFAEISRLADNMQAAGTIAGELKKDVYIRPHIDGEIVPGHKNPELSIGKESITGKLKTYRGDTKFDNYIQNSIKAANTQDAHYLVLHITRKTDFEATLRRKLSGGLSGQNNKIQGVIIIYGHKAAELTRKQILNNDFSPLTPLTANEQ